MSTVCRLVRSSLQDVPQPPTENASDRIPGKNTITSPTSLAPIMAHALKSAAEENTSRPPLLPLVHENLLITESSVEMEINPPTGSNANDIPAEDGDEMYVSEVYRFVSR